MIQTKEEHIELEGVIAVVLPGTMFRVELPNKHVVLATICGKMRKRWVRLTVGDRVKMDLSPYDLDKCRIAWRLELVQSAPASRHGQPSPSALACSNRRHTSPCWPAQPSASS